MTISSVHFKSLRTDWRTPRQIYRELDYEFHFDFDPCPSNPTFNGLAVSWGLCNFVNPPYGKAIENWCKKAVTEWKRGKTIVMLVPARTDTSWWHNYLMKADEIRFIKGRLKFQGAKNPAPFPSAIVVFKKDPLTPE